MRLRLIVVLSALAITGAPGLGQNTTSYVSYRSTISSDANGPLDLWVELNYNRSRTNAPIAVVMHGYSPATGNFANVRLNAQRLRDAGFFVISVAMRGRDGSDGIRDSGGLEIYDIYDAVEYVKGRFASYLNPTNVHITGYSGGGGNVMACLARFPDYFRLGSGFFGMSDYGYNTTTGWYFLGAAPSHQAQLVTDVGNPAQGNPAVMDRYLARAANLASQNNPYGEIHLFANQDEPTCPPVNNTSYRDHAIAHQSYAGEFDNITVHLGGPGQYVDFDGDAVHDSWELQSWPHGFPTADQQRAAESWYLSRLLAGQIPQPVLNDEDELTVIGFVKTRRFSFWLGDGQNAAAELNYGLGSDRKQFHMDLLSSNLSVTGRLTVDTSDMAGAYVIAWLDQERLGGLQAQAQYILPALADGQCFALERARPGDANLDGLIDLADLGVLSSNWGCRGVGWCEGDFSGNQVVDVGDLGVLAGNWGSYSPAGQWIVPEPGTMSLLALSGLALIRRRRG